MRWCSPTATSRTSSSCIRRPGSLPCGADFSLLGPDSTAIPCRVPVISVLAMRTGAGKSPTSRFVADLLMAHGVTPTVIRHPMPYGDLVAQRVQTLRRSGGPRPSRSDGRGARGLRAAYPARPGGLGRSRLRGHRRRGAEGGVGHHLGRGNNDFSFLRSDLEIVVVDPMRAGHELAYHPGEMNLRRADIVVVSKVNSAFPHDVEAVMANIREVNPRAIIVQTDTVVSASDPGLDQGHVRCWWWRTGPRSPMGAWRAEQASRRRGSSKRQCIVNPRPYAQGNTGRHVRQRTRIWVRSLPAVGYYEEQLRGPRGDHQRGPSRRGGERHTVLARAV